VVKAEGFRKTVEIPLANGFLDISPRYTRPICHERIVAIQSPRKIGLLRFFQKQARVINFFVGGVNSSLKGIYI